MAQSTTRHDLSSSAVQRWEFRPEGGEWVPIRVPAGGWRPQGHTCDAGAYRTMLRIPKEAAGQAIHLEFAAINFGARIFVGRSEADLALLAEHVNGWLPVTVDLTPHVEPGGDCLLLVEVQGRKKFLREGLVETIENGQRKLISRSRYIIPEAAFWSPDLADGILRGVELVVRPPVFVQDVFVRTSVDDDSLHPIVTISNTTAGRVTGTVHARLQPSGNAKFDYPTLPGVPVALEPGETRQVDLLRTLWGLGPASYWWPNVPYQAGYRAVLHQLEVTFEAGRAVHQVVQRFGFRQFQQRGNRWLLNGVVCNLRGDNQQEANFGTDAYGTFPGFGPPTRDNPGWPAAVDSLLRLHFNVLRIHQVPGTPYMLDVADELGLMIVDETPVRGSEQQEDFVGGWTHMLNCARELARRDRHHPSIVLWSAANEIWRQRPLALALIGAMREVDDTRPIIIDGTEDLGPDIINMEHYTSGLGYLPEKGGTPRTDRPYGETEAVWPMDNCRQGFAWMATATRIRRLKGNADIRNYVLNNAWPNYVPGQCPGLQLLEKKVKDIRWPQVTSDMEILPAIPKPWQHPLILLMQKCFHPVAVCDVEFDQANKLSDVEGCWPVVKPSLPAGAEVRRQLAVFNDTFAGENVQVAWEVRLGRPGGKLHASGRVDVRVPLGEHRTVPIGFTTPARGEFVLILRSYKDGVLCFEDDLPRFVVA